MVENDDAVTRGLIHALKSYKFIATIYLLSDVSNYADAEVVIVVNKFTHSMDKVKLEVE